MSPNPKLIDKWLASLPRQSRRAISGIVATADASNTPLYLVGGPLRDLLLDRASLDIDLVVDGNAIELAQRAAHYLEASVKTHPAFGTATITIPPAADVRAPLGAGGEGALTTRHSPLTTIIDLATARTETYARPGALPKTTPATIEEDLHRRDFTINAIALRLNGPDRGELLDPTSGLADLESRSIRILHDRSFQDDPTRILRAARYAARLGFRIERHTLDHLKRDTSYVERVSGTRLHHEFALIFDEPAPETTLRHLDDLAVLLAVHPALRFERAEATTFQRLHKFVGQGFTLTTNARAAYWPALALRLSASDATSLAARFALTNPQRTAVEAMPRLIDLGSALTGHIPRRGALRVRLRAAGGDPPPSSFLLPSSSTPGLPRSAIAELLAPFPLPALWAYAAASKGRARTRLLDYITTARHTRPALRGDDLIALGVPQGPVVGDILRRLRATKLDGGVKTKTDEIRLVRTINNVGDLNGGSVVGQRNSLRGKHGAGL